MPLPRPRRWRDLPLRLRGAALALVPVLLVGTLLFGAARLTRVTTQLDRVLHHVNDVHVQTLDLHRLLNAAESAVRGFRLLDGRDPALLAPYTKALRDVPGRLEALEQAVDEYPELRGHVDDIERLVERRLELLAQLRELPPAAVTDPRVVPFVREGLTTSSQLRLEVLGLEDAERRLAARLDDELQALRDLTWLAWGALGLAMVLSFAGAAWFTRDLARRIAILHRNTMRLIEGEALEPMPEGDDELGRLGAALEETAGLLETRDIARIAAQAEAERANEAKSTFLSRMSHELRTPLTAVLGFSELLEMEDLDDSQRDSVRHIRRAGVHLLELINEVLDISRIEAGTLPLSVEPVEIGRLAEDAIALIRPMAEERSIELPRSVPSGAFVRADRQRVTQVLLNLLSNAVKYNRQGGRVTVECEEVGAVVRLSVIDTGHGIAPELLPRLFAPFDRLGAEASGVEGTGVGLALSKALVEAMGGRLSVQSQYGAGSVFTVELPTSERPDLAPVAPQAPHVRQRRRNVTVLYVEDNSANVDLLTALLARQDGVELVSAMQGRLAVDLARAHQPHLILLDLHLPDVSGEEVLRRLREDELTSSIPVVMLTADASSGQARRLKAMGARDYLTKPLDFTRLLGLLDLVASRA
jgi:signal transduction histidine kinase/CheY-like chemotaxis protein